MPATKATETGTKNWHVCRSNWYVFSCRSFLHATEHSSITAQKLCDTWHEPCNV